MTMPDFSAQNGQIALNEKSFGKNINIISMNFSASLIVEI